jgi:hypothetical protein
MAACSSDGQQAIGGAGGASFDPCSANPAMGFDPVARGLDKCCVDGPAHCIPADAVPSAIASNLAACPSGDLCLPDTAIEAGASYKPAQCTSLAKQPGVCLSLCIPRVGNDPQVGLLPQDICTDGEVCVPCINPLSMMATGACQLLDIHCGDGGATTGGQDAGPAMCPYTGPPIIDPATLGDCAPACGGAHCVPATLVPAAQQSLLDPCMASGKPGFCAPDDLIKTGGNYIPPSCRSVAGAEGRCVSTCLPSVAAQADVLPQDTCASGFKCAPCFNPIAADPNAPTGACTIGCDKPAEPPLVITCPWTGKPLTDPAMFPPCSPACSGSHCVPSSLVPAAQQSLLAACQGGFCVPDEITASGNHWIPPSCTSIVGAEGRCVSTCLPSVAAQASLLPQDKCPTGTKCAPCFNPTAADPNAPTGACNLGCDKPAKPPVVITCPWTGPQVVNPASFPACSPACGGAHCVPAAQVPAAQQSLLATCTGGFCVPDPIVAAAGEYVPPTCTSVAGAEGRCMSTCLPSVAAQKSLLPQSTCPTGTKCAPCFNPTAANPKAPTGACTLACDSPKKPPVILTCPWTGPAVVDPAAFPACSPSCGGAHCVPAAMVPVAQQSLLAQCPGGFCAPDPVIKAAGNYVPKSCTPFDGAPAEGRCLSECIPLVAQKSSQLQQDVCDAGDLCVPCYDPFTGDATGACTTACDHPTEPPYTFPGCCSGGGTCVPQAQVPAGQASNLSGAGCPSQFLCVPDEYLPDSTVPIGSCSTLLFGYGTCVSLCVNLPAGAGIFGQRSCPDNHTCVPCSLAPAGTPGC